MFCLSFPIRAGFNSFSRGQAIPILGFSHISVWSLLVSLWVVSTTPGLPPQLLCSHFLLLLAQNVQSPTVKKRQEVWLPTGLKRGSLCPPNIFLHLPLLPDFTQLRSTHMGTGFLPPYLSPPNSKTQHASYSAQSQHSTGRQPHSCVSWRGWVPPKSRRDEKNLRTWERSWTRDPERKGQTQGCSNLSSHPQPTPAH